MGEKGNGVDEKEMFSQSSPLVSIVTPVYNQKESYLRETIDGVLGQTYPNIEYIVLDDGSTNNVPQVLESYNGQLSWESHPNMGQAKTINKGWKMSHGEIVGLVNSDDAVLPNLVESVVHCMQKNPDILLVYPDWFMINAEGKIISHVQTSDYDYLNMLRWHQCTPGAGTFFRRKAFDLVGMLDPQYRHIFDFDYWLRLGLCGQFARIPEYLAKFRVHADSASIAHLGERIAMEHIYLITNFYSRRDLPREVHHVRKQALSAAYYNAATACLPMARSMARHYFLTCLRYYPLYPLLCPYRSFYGMLVAIETITLPAVVRNFLVDKIRKLIGNAAAG